MANPLLVASLLNFGSGLFGGGNPYEKYNKAGLGYLQGELGRDPVNVDQQRSRAISTAIPQVKQSGEAINKRFGFDSGKGQSAIMKILMDKLTEFDLNQAPQIQSQNAAYKSRVAQILAGAGGGY